jgi:acyl-CoA synthetase (AMP-forming)/AMP-acid ligase II
MPSPISHATGLQWGLRTALLLRAPLILQDRWDAARALDLIDQYQCNYTLVATPFILDLIGEATSQGRVGTPLELVASGGAPIPPQLSQEVEAVLGGCLLAVFGATETFITTATSVADSAPQRPSDGRPMRDVEVVICDPSGAFLPVGAEGEIVTRGPHVFAGYIGDPELTMRTFRDGWYRFGDLGSVDEHGYLRVTGRIKDIVIRGGQNISVREVEEALAQCDEVADVAIVGYSDRRLGERCCAFVVAANPASPPTLDGLVLFLRNRGMAAYKLPERLRLIEEIPMTVTGKQRKTELRAMIRDSPQ